MSTTTAQVRDGLVARLQLIPELAAERTWPGQINPPTAIVRITGIDYAESFDQMNLYHAEIVLAVRVAQLATGFEDLDLYVDPTGERAISFIVEGDQALGGVAEIVNVLRMHDYGDLMLGGATYLGAIFDVDIYAT